MIRPTTKSVVLLASAIPVALLPVFLDRRLWVAWIVVFVVSSLAVGLDAILCARAKSLELRAQPPPLLFIGETDPLRIEMSWRGRTRAPFVEALCDLDEVLEPQPSQKVQCSPSGPTAIEFSLLPRRRGTARIARVWLRWPGPLGLVERVVRRPLDQDVAVVPNLRAVRRAAVHFFGAREFLSGLKVEKTLGDGSEFASLREFLPGFDSRAIDWKSSARHSKLLCREYRAERNHQVVLAFDTGRLMGEPLDGISRLDHAINASLLLGYVCLKTGDRVGLVGFDERVRTFAEPKGGIASFAALQKAAARLDASPAETNFTLGLTELAARLKRRALVLLLTDFVDTITAELMLENLERLARRHLVLFASLRDPTPARIMATVPNSLDDISRAVVAHDIQVERELVFKRLRRLGIGSIETSPGHLSVQLVQRYLDIKRRERI